MCMILRSCSKNMRPSVMPVARIFQQSFEKVVEGRMLRPINCCETHEMAVYAVVSGQNPFLEWEEDWAWKDTEKKSCPFSCLSS